MSSIDTNSTRRGAAEPWCLASIALSALATAAAVWLLVGVKTVPIGSNTIDFVTMLDGARRLTLGELVHRDFHSAIGVLTYAALVAAYTFNPGAASYVGMHGIIWLLCLPVAAMAHTAIGGWRGSVAILVLAASILMPFNIDGMALCTIAYNVPYNRWGAGLLFAVLVVLLGRDKPRLWQGAVLGYVLVLMWLCKATYMLATLGLVLVCAIARPAYRKPLTIAIVVAAVGFAVAELTMGSVSGQLADLVLFHPANDRSLWVGAAIGASRNLGVILLLVVGIATLGAAGGAKAGALTVMVSAVPAVLFIEGQNFGGLGLMPCLAVALQAGFPEHGKHRLTEIAAIMLAVSAYGIVEPWLKSAIFNTACVAKNRLFDRAVASVPVTGFGLMGLVSHRDHIRSVPTPELVALQREHLGDEILHRDPSVFVSYFRQVEELGTQLRTKYPKLSLRTLDFADPAAILSEAQPARPGVPTLHYGRNIGPRSPLFDGRLLSGIDGVLIPRCSLFRDNDRIVALFAPALGAFSPPVQVTSCWDIMLRKP